MSQQQHHDTTSRMRNIKTTPRKRSKFASEIKRSWKASTTPSARQTTRGGEVSWLCKYYVLKAMLNRQHKKWCGCLVCIRRRLGGCIYCRPPLLIKLRQKEKK